MCQSLHFHNNKWTFHWLLSPPECAERARFAVHTRNFVAANRKSFDIFPSSLKIIRCRTILSAERALWRPMEWVSSKIRFKTQSSCLNQAWEDPRSGRAVKKNKTCKKSFSWTASLRAECLRRWISETKMSGEAASSVSLLILEMSTMQGFKGGRAGDRGDNKTKT